jgi:hypothetical protein
MRHSIFLATFTLFMFTACKKYEDGPFISLRSKMSRVENTWRVESYTVNGVDSTATLVNINYTETYEKSGAFSYASTTGHSMGSWDFLLEKNDILRSGVLGQGATSKILHILKLKDKEFWYEVVDGSNVSEMHLIEY